jgi:hypothetical protein
MITLKPTERGFLRGEFVDYYGEKCSIQESSLADEFCIWLGCDHETKGRNGEPVGARMHLTKAMAVDIMMYLQCFIETGELSRGSEQR